MRRLSVPVAIISSLSLADESIFLRYHPHTLLQNRNK